MADPDNSEMKFKVVARDHPPIGPHGGTAVRSPSADDVPGDCPGLFPLPFAPFESMALHDSWPGFPMTCGAVFTFRGTIDTDVFDKAVQVVEKRHPLLSAHVRRSRWGQYRWVRSGQAFNVRWIGDAEATEFVACRPYNLQCEHAVRIWGQQRGDVGKIFVEFHHSCCDGAGGMAFIDDVFATYDRMIKGKPITLPPINPKLLKTRHEFGRPRATLAERIGSFFGDLRQSFDLAWRVPTTVGSMGRSKVLSRQTWRATRMISRKLNRRDYSFLRSQAVESGVTLNDLLVARLFTSLAQWNRRCNPSDDPANRGVLRIVVPVNLRTRADLAMPMTNRLSYGFLTRRISETECPKKLIAGLSAENARLRRQAQPQRLLQKFALLQRMRLWRLIFSPNRCLATAVFSNLGDPTRRFRSRFARKDGYLEVGNLLLTDFEGTTALRPHTRVGVFMNTYGNQVTMNARFDSEFFTYADGEAFLDLFLAEILQTSAIVTGTPRAA